MASPELTCARPPRSCAYPWRASPRSSAAGTCAPRRKPPTAPGSRSATSRRSWPATRAVTATATPATCGRRSTRSAPSRTSIRSRSSTPSTAARRTWPGGRSTCCWRHSPTLASWSLTQQTQFVEAAKGRFEAILAVASLGAEVDDELVGELDRGRRLGGVVGDVAARGPPRAAHLPRPRRADRGRGGRGAGPAVGPRPVALAHPHPPGARPPDRRHRPRVLGRLPRAGALDASPLREHRRALVRRRVRDRPRRPHPVREPVARGHARPPRRPTSKAPGSPTSSCSPTPGPASASTPSTPS